MTESNEKALTIGRIAKLAGVGADTIRFYEGRGLLPTPARTAAGYRLYPLSTVERLNFIRRAKALGFSLEEVAVLLDLADSGGSKSAVKEITHRKLDQINTKIADLERMREVLSELHADCSGKGNVGGCPIIDALSTDQENIS